MIYVNYDKKTVKTATILNLNQLVCACVLFIQKLFIFLFCALFFALSDTRAKKCINQTKIKTRDTQTKDHLNTRDVATIIRINVMIFL